MPDLRPDQIIARDALVEWGTGDPSITHTLVAPMSAGKTAITCNATNALVKLGLRVWICVHSSDLADQWKKELGRFAPDLKTYGRDVGLVQGNNSKALHRMVQVCMVQTLNGQLPRIREQHKPDVVFFDEAHTTAFYKKVPSVIKNRWPQSVQINLTATPTRHGKALVPYTFFYPKKDWLVLKLASEMIAEKLWKTPIWKTASAELAAVTKQRYSGIKIDRSGEYESTAAGAVMIDLLPYHLAEWQALGGTQHQCIFFCVNLAHVEAVTEALRKLGRNAVAITSETDKDGDGLRKKALDNFRDSKGITDLVSVSCLIAGVDLPVASCGVWLKVMNSVSEFNQSTGRLLRKYQGIDDALLLDLAGNLAIHPFPEMMDWSHYNPVKRMFTDPASVVCKSCMYRHNSVPTPQHPTDKKVRWMTKIGNFADGLEINHKTIISCHSCKKPVYFNAGQLYAYGGWLAECGKAKARGDHAPKFEGDSMGISIGVQTSENNIPLRIADLYDSGLWKMAERPQGEAVGPAKDRSEEYEELLIKTDANFASYELCQRRMQALTAQQQQFFIGCSVAKLQQHPDVAGRYRAAIALAFVNDRHPISAYQFWDKGLGKIPDSEIAEALSNIHRGEADISEMLSAWLEHHKAASTSHEAMGICTKIAKLML